MGLFGGNSMPVAGKTILITGGSEGLGLSAATQLSAKGANIVLVSRSADKLEKALQQVKAVARDPSKQRFHYIPADVSKEDYAVPIIDDVTSWNDGQPPDIVWCVAGMSRPELFLDMDVSSIRRTMDINFFGAAEMAHAILKVWLAPDFPVESQPRHLIMTGSTILYFTIAGYASYSPSKSAMRSLADTLSHEVLLYPQNVKVHLVVPGTILSAGFEREMTTKPAVTKFLEEVDPQQTPDEVAKGAIAGLEKGHYMITVNWLGNLMRWGGLGGSLRNNWFVDTFMVIITFLIIWPIFHMDILGKTRNYGKKHGHPATWKKQA